MRRNAPEGKIVRLRRILLLGAIAYDDVGAFAAKTCHNPFEAGVMA